MILLFFIALFLLVNVSAQDVQTLGTFKTAECITLKQICANCTFVNLSISTPPNQTTIIVNQSMTRQTTNLWIYSFCNTTINGEYMYDTFGNLNGNLESSSVNFFVNPVGKMLTSAQATLYFMIFIVSFIMFLICFVFGVSAPGDNKKDEMTGYIIAVSNIKYLKVFLISCSYLLLLLMVYFGYLISYGYLDLDFLGSMFRFGYISMVVLILPLFIVGTYIVIANWVRDSKVSDMLSRGLRAR